MVNKFERNSEPPVDINGENMGFNLAPIIKWGSVVLALVVLFIVSSFGRSVYTDVVWFDALGFQSVYMKILSTKILLFLIGLIAFAIPASINFWVAYKQSHGEINIPLPFEVSGLLRKAVILGTTLVTIVLGVIFGIVLA